MITFPTIFPVTSHTKYVGPGSTFIAIKGHKEDGIIYIPEAIRKGATRIVIEEQAPIPPEIVAAINASSVEISWTENTRAALAELSAQAYGYPAGKLKIIAITGTKGKTTCSCLLHHVLKTAGYNTALLSTVKNFIGDTPLETELTTQQPDYLHTFFNLCVQKKVEYVVMEVAAQAKSLHRIDTLNFDGLLFTNFAQEHAEFYPTMQEYFAAKSSIIHHLKAQAPLILNADNAWCQKLATSHNPCLLFSIQDKADVTSKALSSNAQGIIFEAEVSQTHYHFHCPSLLGSFNIANATAVVTMTTALGIDIATIQKGLTTFEKVPGRLEKHALRNGTTCIIDYAHNPSSFEAVLPLLKSLTSQLIVVFGCGGDRDKTKRPLMGAIATQHADLVILTTDNPRSEDPATIVQEILAGIPAGQISKVIVELDREKAIIKAVSLSEKKSIIALLGKGPDEYQQVGSVKVPFSEAQIIQNMSI